MNKGVLSLAKKPGGGGGGAGKSKYSCSLVPSTESFSVNLNYYGGECLDGECYEPTYRNEPSDLTSDQYVSFTVSARSRNDRDWFNFIVLAFAPDLDMDGTPDSEDFTMGFTYSFGLDQKLTECLEENILFWWGQRTSMYDYPHCCLRILTQEECGRYLVKIMLRQEATKGKGGRTSHPVYSSTEDADFQEYDDITKGYVPIIAFGGL